MSFDTYISLMVGVILVSIIAIFTDLHFSKAEVVDDVNNTIGRRKQNKILTKYNRCFLGNSFNDINSYIYKIKSK